VRLVKAHAEEEILSDRLECVPSWRWTKRKPSSRSGQRERSRSRSRSRSRREKSDRQREEQPNAKSLLAPCLENWAGSWRGER